MRLTIGSYPLVKIFFRFGRHRTEELNTDDEFPIQHHDHDEISRREMRSNFLEFAKYTIVSAFISVSAYYLIDDVQSLLFGEKDVEMSEPSNSLQPK